MKLKRISRREFIISHPGPLQWISPKSRLLDVDVFIRIIMGDDAKDIRLVILLIEPKLYLLEQRTADTVDVAGCAKRMDTHCAEQIPGRHLAHIIVSAESLGAEAICILQDPPAPFLRQPWTSGAGKDIRQLVDRFVRMV